MEKWTKQRIEEFVNNNGGETFGLVDEFPFSENARQQINDAFENEEEYTDSDVCDLILELALNEVG